MSPRTWIVAGLIPTIIACGPGDLSIQATVDTKILTAVAAIPTATPLALPTSLPTATPFLIPSPVPTPTAITFPTPLPTVTPVVIPSPVPTPTPITIASPTPQPTATPQPTPTPQQIPDLSAVYEQNWTAVFYIETSQGHGTGWLVAPGEIITAQHVVGQSTSVTVRSAIRDAFPATVFARDSLRDVALITFNPSVVSLPGVTPIKLAASASNLPIGSPVLGLGYTVSGIRPDGRVGSPKAKAGIKSQIIGYGSDSLGQNVILDAPLDPGDSGGPLFSPAGELIGMARAAVERTGSQRVVGVFYAVAVDEIADRLPALRAGNSR